MNKMAKTGFKLSLTAVLSLVLLAAPVRAEREYSLLGFPHGGIAPGVLVLTRLHWAILDWEKYDKGPVAIFRMQCLSIKNSADAKSRGIEFWTEISHMNLIGDYGSGRSMNSRVTSIALSVEANRFVYELTGNLSLSVSPGVAVCHVDADYRSPHYIYDGSWLPVSGTEGRGGEIFWGFPIFLDFSLVRIIEEKRPETRLRIPLRIGSPALFQFVRAKPRNDCTIQERNYPFPYTGLSLAALLEFEW